MSNPALVTRIALRRVPTPAPKTRSRTETIWTVLADTDARIGCAMRMLVADAAIFAISDREGSLVDDSAAAVIRGAFLARGQALLLDLETAMQLVTALQPLDPAQARWLRDRALAIPEQRRRVEMLLRRASP
jgi:hypothetical protein